MEKQSFETIRAGEIVGKRYRVISLLGQGGMGSVYLAEDLKLNGRKRAVKQTRMDFRTPGQVHTEAELLMRLNHPYLPDIVDYFADEQNGCVYLVIDYIQGRTLEEEFQLLGKKLDRSELVRIAVQLCDLLEYLHHGSQQPVIYRDLKPSNVMIDEQRNICLIDFGIARHYKQDGRSDTLRLGTIGFAAPEQFEHAQSDERTDLYALGAMLYYFFSEGQIYYLTGIPLSELVPGLPQTLAFIVDKLLKNNPGERFQKAAEVKSLLLDIQRSGLEPAATAFGYGSADEHQRRVEPSSKLIAVAGIYPGAGSSFIALTIARALHRQRIYHALIESPCHEPDLFFSLFGDETAPEKYRFLTDQIVLGETIESHISWQAGYSTWFPVSPLGIQSEWRDKDWMKLLYTAKLPVVIVDVSHQMDHPSIAEIMAIADELVFVADPFPAKMNRLLTLTRMEKIKLYRKQGKHVHLVANRDTPLKIRKEWMAAMPFPPVCAVPDIPTELMLEAMWRKKLPQDSTEIDKLLDKAIAPLIQRLFSGSLERPASKRKSMFHWLKK